MNHLLRELAPITDGGWDQLQDEARRQLVSALAARKLVDFSGPHGWQHSATNLGRVETLKAPVVEGVAPTRRRVLPLVEPRVAFSVARAELHDIARGAEDPDLGGLEDAARRIALAENVAVFQGWEEAGITGMTGASPHEPIPLSDDLTACPGHIARAVELLLRSGVSGPYGLALSPEVYKGVVETTEHGGYPLFDHLRKILDGPLVWAPGVDGAIVASMRGGDFLFDCGQDIAIGYDSHDSEGVELYFVESFSFRVVTPEAAVALPAVKGS
ncbi:MAG TPA: family 1 encapsulin nanocompartment shell protein [Solirubrobacteraceae bacterium]|nr:family 1 encapsulin nanocompartment shell protein [Solirubrobacteraceae bacterium]